MAFFASIHEPETRGVTQTRVTTIVEKNYQQPANSRPRLLKRLVYNMQMQPICGNICRDEHIVTLGDLTCRSVVYHQQHNKNGSEI